MTAPEERGRFFAKGHDSISLLTTLAERAKTHASLSTEEAELLRQKIRERTLDLLDEWSKIAMELNQAGVALQYQIESRSGPAAALRVLES